MSFNWFDIILIAVIGITVIIGIIKGLMRQLIGIAAVIAGLILAMNFYPRAANILSPYIKNPMLSCLLGFLVLFFGTLIVGGFLAWLISKLMRGPLKFVNHILGAALGLIEGILICGVIVLAQMMFPVNQNHLYSSELAPYCARMVKVAYRMIPQEVKAQFNDTYEKIIRDKGETQ